MRRHHAVGAATAVGTTIAGELVTKPGKLMKALPPLAAAVLAQACAFAPFAHADSLPQWEMGIGLAGVTLPSYRGAETRRNYILPAPFIVYRGERIRADRSGVRASLLRNESFELNVSANLSLARTGNDDPIRSGMTSLRPVAEIGPTADFALWRAADQGMSLDFRLPVRAGVTLESSPRHIGWLFAPNLALRVQDPVGLRGWNFGVQGGPQFADRRWHDYYYAVSAAEATAARPAYASSAGYGGMQFTGTLSRRYPNFWVGAFVRYDNLAGAVFRDSPLVRETQGLTAGLAVTWIFGASDKKVQSSD
jgi:MipA family protein